jgi:tRNA A58 N-methylase Trm61
LIELAGIKQGSKILDIAIGIGEPSITAAQLVGKNGHVWAKIYRLECWQLQKRGLYLSVYKI